MVSFCHRCNPPVGRHSVFATVTIRLWGTTASLPLLQSVCGAPQRLCHCCNQSVGRHSVFATVTISLWDATASLPLLQSVCGLPQRLCHCYNQSVGCRRRLCHRYYQSKHPGFVSLHTCTNSKNVIPCSCCKRSHPAACHGMLCRKRTVPAVVMANLIRLLILSVEHFLPPPPCAVSCLSFIFVRVIRKQY